MSLPKEFKFGLTKSQPKKIKEKDKKRKPLLNPANKCKTQNKKKIG
jgi:hypothetical protein